MMRKKKPQCFVSVKGWHKVGDQRCFFRSKWEHIYAKHLQFLQEKGLISSWLYEPETFWFDKIRRGVCSYKPDFKVLELDGWHYWVEVKGYMDSRSKTKIARMKKYYPKERLLIIDKKWFVKK